MMGVLAALPGHAVVAFGRWPRYALAFFPLVMGTHLMGWLRLPMPARPGTSLRLGFAAAFSAGFVLALMVGSCGRASAGARLVEGRRARLAVQRTLKPGIAFRRYRH